MTPEAQRIAIAEACGWTNIRPSNVWWYGLRPGNNGMGDMPGEAIPEYLNDLNVMHEAEKMLPYEKQPAYIHAIKRTVMRVSPIGAADDFETASATAAQRAEAFLRTLGKWKDA